MCCRSHSTALSSREAQKLPFGGLLVTSLDLEKPLVVLKYEFGLRGGEGRALLLNGRPNSNAWDTPNPHAALKRRDDAG
jgi:hypothetical protein